MQELVGKWQHKLGCKFSSSGSDHSKLCNLSSTRFHIRGNLDFQKFAMAAVVKQICSHTNQLKAEKRKDLVIPRRLEYFYSLLRQGCCLALHDHTNQFNSSLMILP